MVSSVNETHLAYFRDLFSVRQLSGLHFQTEDQDKSLQNVIWISSVMIDRAGKPA